MMGAPEMTMLKKLAVLFGQDFELVFANSEDVFGDLLSSFDGESMRALIRDLDDLLERSDGQIQALWESAGAEIRIDPPRDLRVLLKAIRERASSQTAPANGTSGSQASGS
jgi:hypothetical protein